MGETPTTRALPESDPSLPVLVRRDGRLCWSLAGRVFPIIAGGDGSDDDSGQDDAKTAGDQGGDDDAGTDDAHDPERARALIAKLRPFEREARRLQKALDGANKELQQHRDARLSETERLQQRVRELEAERERAATERRELLGRTAVQDAAVKAGIVDPDAAYRLLDPADFVTDEKGHLSNAAALVAALVAAKPYLKPATAAGNPANPARAGGGGSTGEAEADRRRRLLG